MGNQGPSGSTVPIRIFRIRRPVQKPRVPLAFGLAIFSIFAWIFVFLFSHQVVQGLIASGLIPRSFEHTFPSVLAFIGVGLLFVSFSIWDRQGHENAKSLRERRLNRITSVPQSLARFPHRHLELLFHKRRVDQNAIRQLLINMPPRTVILVNCIRNNEFMAETDGFFEPIDIHRDFGGLLKIATETKDLEAQPTTDKSPWISDLFGRALAIGLTLSFIGFFTWAGYQFYLLIARNDTLGAWLSIGLFCSFLGFAVLFSLRQKRWYLIPGGLVRTDQKLWKKDCRTTLCHPDCSPLVLHCDDGFGYLIASGRVMEFQFEESVWIPILAGWRSAARRPTLEEVTVFVAGRTEVG